MIRMKWMMRIGLYEWYRWGLCSETLCVTRVSYPSLSLWTCLSSILQPQKIWHSEQFQRLAWMSSLPSLSPKVVIVGRLGGNWRQRRFDRGKVRRWSEVEQDRSCGPMDKASDYESGDCRFESCQDQTPFWINLLPKVRKLWNVFSIWQYFLNIDR